MSCRPAPRHCLLCTLVATVFTTTPAFAADPIDGDWTLDLRPTNEAPAYIKSMALHVEATGVVTGDFYDHAIEDGRAFSGKGRACFSFRTSDNSGPYQTSGCRVGDRIEGQTWSEGRRFLLTWTAVRAAVK